MESYTTTYWTLRVEDDPMGTSKLEDISYKKSPYEEMHDELMRNSQTFSFTEKSLSKGEGRVRGFELISDEQVSENFEEFPVRKLPKRGTAKSAGYDFFAPYPIHIEVGGVVTIPTGIKAYMQDDEYLGILIRSSLGFKHNLRIVNQEGVIDSDYYDNEDNEGHIFIKIQNQGDEDVLIDRGEGVAQGIFKKYLLADGDSLDGKERTGGIGSTNE